MSDLIINNYLINAPIVDILTTCREQLTNGKLMEIKPNGDYVSVTCPEHSNGQERHTSCSVYCGDGTLQYGWAHCFTCGLSCPLPAFIGKCFNKTENWGKQWLLENFGYTYLGNKSLNISDITLGDDSKKYLDESILLEFSDYHPYMTQRHLTDEVIKKYEIKYDPTTKCIVFPVRDLQGRLVGLTRRSTVGKKFIIDKGFSKENIYLLYNNMNEREVYVVESQINALTLEGWGYHAIALFGAGTTKEQMNVLNHTQIRHFILCYDNDEAGKKGASNFKRMIRGDAFVDEIIMPEGKDVNDLTKEEFEEILNG